MLIVALKPIKLRLDDGDHILIPGQQVDLPDDQARLVLARAAGKVRLVEPDKPDWLAEWHMLAYITDNMMADDPRFQPVMAALQQCDTHFLANDWPSFRLAVEQVKAAITCKTKNQPTIDLDGGCVA